MKFFNSPIAGICAMILPLRLITARLVQAYIGRYRITNQRDYPQQPQSAGHRSGQTEGIDNPVTIDGSGSIFFWIDFTQCLIHQVQFLARQEELGLQLK